MDSPALSFLAVLVVLVFGAVLWQAARRPVQRRLALRNVVRRRGETALVVAGSLLGTALITGSFIVGDTLDASIRAGATTSLGTVDEVIEVNDPAAAGRIERAVAQIDDPRIDGVMSFTTASASATSDASGTLQAEPRAQVVELDFAAASSFGGKPDETGISGEAPAENAAVVNQDVADSLGVAAGDSLTVYLYGDRLELVVDRVIPKVGLAGYTRGFGITPNVFVAPGTIDTVISKELPEDALPPTRTVAISNRGGVEDAVDLTGEVTALVEDARGDEQVRVQPVKQDLLDAAEGQGDEFGQLFLAIGSFAIVAGILLLVNIFVMVAEERKSQLGMLRAVGTRRSDLVRTFVIEGACYSLMAGVLGAITGIGVGWAIVRLAAPIFSSGGEFSLDLLFSAEPTSIATGFCLGLLISMVTIFFTSVRISRINIIRAVRDLPEPARDRARPRMVLLGLLLAAAAGAMFVGSLGSKSGWFGVIVGPPLIAFGLLPLAGRVVGRRPATIIAAAFALSWGMFGNRILDGEFFESGEMFAFVVQGILLTFSAVVLLSQLQENMAAGLHRVAARNLPLRLSLAYPLARRFRTALTLGMYSLVMFTMVFIATMAAIFGGQIDTAVAQESGGYDMLVRTSRSNPVPGERLQEMRGIEGVAPLVSADALWKVEGSDEPSPWPVTGITEEFVTDDVRELEERADDYADDEAAWNAVVDDPRYMIVDPFFLQAGGGPPQAAVEMGSTLTLVNPQTGDTAERIVVGITATDYAFNGSFMARESVTEALPGLVSPSRFAVDAEDPAAAADRLEAEFVEYGVRADTFRALVEEQQALQGQFLNLMQGYLALGLLVGIAGLGVVMVRAVRERRREIGVLRSLGFLPQRVRRAFLLESGFVALEGIVVGSLLALVTAAQLTTNGDFGRGIHFVVPWVALAVLIGASMIASLLATAAPAQQASQIPPAVALRTAE